GFNFGPWRLRNLSSWQNLSSEKKFESAYIYAERGLKKIKSKLTVGDKYTSADLFDSVPFRGFSLNKDESMIPFSQRTYYPTIRGIAKTNATVEVRQNGYLIYSTSVPPGQFEIGREQIADLGVGVGVLDVSIYEKNGQVQNYTVPYSTPVLSLPDGYSKYSVTIGRYREVNNDYIDPVFFEGTYIYGLPYGFTLFGGVQWVNIYNSYAIGASKDIGEYGALSFDWKTSVSKTDTSNENGHAYGIRYNKNIAQTNTEVSLASHYYYSKNYRTFSEAIHSSEHDEFYDKNKKSTTSMLLSQALGSLGSVNLSYNYDKYWKHEGKKSIIASYGKNLNGVSLSLSYTKSTSKISEENEDLFSFLLSVPLQKLTNHEMYATYQNSSSSKHDMNHDLGITGVAFNSQLTWQARGQIEDKSKNQKATFLNASWRGTYGEIGANYSHNEINRDIGMNVSGGVIAHSSGITFGQSISDTAALVEAKGVSGAKVLGLPGVRTDFRGYTISSYLTPYMNNFISIDPTTLPINTDIRQTDIQVVPTEGAIVKAVYKTSVGTNALIRITRTNGKPLALGTVLSLKNNDGVIQSTSIVGEDGQAYVSGLSGVQKLIASWGNKPSDTCTVFYSLPDKNKGQISFLNGVCK
ncbi:outer membrane fimbrial usher protein SefC, partial [Salmonella enterica subsp. enterica serovar Enteritidis]|nr:outer membrane fimbrial usher protein SefC [Salmonella enterica subsp. enterica serovar Enteritidis]